MKTANHSTKTCMKQHLTATMLATMALVSPPALAGRTCETPQPPKVYTVKRALTLAERTLKALDSSGARVVVLTRAGQDLSQYGLRYSHLGLAYRQEDGEGGHVWRVLHKLNQCGTADSALYRQGLGEFFLDDLWRFEAAWVVPTEPVQAKLLALLQDEPRALQLHHQPYSMVSYAWGQKYQQSNQWAIETMSLALSPAMANGWGTRKQAQNWLHSQGYQPTSLHIGPFTRLGARVTAANVAFDDHPTEKRFSDRIETVTVDSVFDWLMQSGLGQTLVKLPPN
ncbi:MAG: hypothetical protein RL710_2315 [Pseudomonadota bacterium]|jgi:hypothetical protein